MDVQPLNLRWGGKTFRRSSASIGLRMTACLQLFNRGRSAADTPV